MDQFKKETKNSPQKDEFLGGKFKFVFWITIVLVLVIGGFGVLLIRSQSFIIKNEITQRGKILAEFISTVVEVPSLYGDYVELERITKEIIQGYEDIIDYIVIFNQEGNPLTFSSRKPTIIDPQRTLVVSAPILEDFGWVEIGYSLVPLKNQERVLVFNIGISIFLSILISSLGIIFISRKLIIQPAEVVSQINLQLKELTEDLEKKVKERTLELEKERALLEIKVKERTQELEKLTATLESQVEERTKELNKRLEELGESRVALINILEDVEVARGIAEEERQKTLSIIENFADGLIVFDKEGKLVLINPQAEKFLEIKSENVTGKSLIHLLKIQNFKPLTDFFEKREIKTILKKEIFIKENLILEVSTIPLIKNKETIGTLMIMHDISREKFVEKMKTEFVSIAAHQLRTPLSAIKWTIRMLLDGDLGKITKEQKDFLEKTYKSNERMINLINDLLDVTRIEEGRYVYKPVFTRLEPIVLSMLESYKEIIKKNKLEVQFLRPKEELPKVLVDVEKIKLAIQNLIDNAVKYTPEGNKIIISLKREKDNIEFSIKDTGIGIPKYQQERIFTKFFRGVNALKIQTEGTGLGLFITKNIIEAHNGKIWFESEEGKGTTFYVTLPIAK